MPGQRNVQLRYSRTRVMAGGWLVGWLLATITKVVSISKNSNIYIQRYLPVLSGQFYIIS